MSSLFSAPLDGNGTRARNDVRKLLIADDEPGIRRLVRMTLQSDDYEILEAADGEEAVKLAREHKP